MTFLWNSVLTCVLFIAMASALEETVNTTSGVVMGTRVTGTNVIKFLGIPYAEPPVGERRFKPPVMKTRVAEIFNATTDGFSCPQTIPLDFTGWFNFSVSEDCLNLNIFAPVKASKSEPLPVMVWVYGGAYANGAAILYDSTLLSALNDVIVIVINYRIGILGFLNTMDDNSVGNFGLRDQCLALRWVKENIEEFGGNTSSITIFGESAGAGSVTQLTMAVSCEGLFHRVIAQSGSPLAPWAHNDDPLKSAKELGNQLSCPTDKTSSLVQCLREKSVAELLEQQPFRTDFMFDISPWVPSYTSDFFSFVPKELPIWKGILVKNKMNEFDLMTGLNMEEGELIYELLLSPLRENGEIHDKTEGLPFKFLNERLTRVAEKTLPGDTNRAHKLLPSLRFQYTDWKNIHSTFTNSKMLVELMSDEVFHVSSVQYARLHAKFAPLQTVDSSRTGHTYFYRLKPRGSWLTSNPWTVGATHGDDMAFLFGALVGGFLNSTAEERHLSRVMMEYWTNFAKTGNPNEPSKVYIDTEWPIYTIDAEEYIELDINMTRKSTGEHPYAERIAFWDTFIPEQVKLFQNEAVPEPCDTNAASPAGSVYTRSSTTLVTCLSGIILTVFIQCQT